MLVHQVDDELELVQALEISHFRLIPGFDENLESSFHQSRSTAAEHDLLTEKIGHGFFAEVGFKHTSTSASDATSPSQRGLLGLARNILMNGDQTGNTFARHELRTNGVTWALGGNQNDIHKLR